MNAPNQGTQEGKDAAPDLGILFIHGIGHQAAGETLVQFGDPLLRWIDEWLRWGHLSEKVSEPGITPEKVGEPEITRYEAQALSAYKKATREQRARLDGISPRIEVRKAGIKCEEGMPAYAKVEFVIPGRAPNRWLMAESCWAETFVTPAFRDLAFWGFVVYPWTNAAHFGAQIRRLWRSLAGEKGGMRALALTKAFFMTPVLFVGSVIVSILVMAVLLLLLALAIPPIPSLRAMLLRLQQRLADSLGDSFILAVSPIQKGAIISRVGRDFDWLIGQKCRKIAVIAHSQGAAVAFETLANGVAEERKPGETLLVTFGSGLAKLREAESAHRSDKAIVGWLPIIGLSLVVVGLELFKVIDLLPFVSQSMAFGGLCVFVGLLCWMAGAAQGATNQLDPNDFMPVQKFGAEVAWDDYYASHDPVPNGALFTDGATFLKSAEIHNHASLWSDHTTYWLNRDEFLPRIVEDLSVFAEHPILDTRPLDGERVATAQRRRKWRVRWLAWARLMTWSVAGLVMFARWEDLPKWGAAVLDQLLLAEKVFAWIIGEKGIIVGGPLPQRLLGIALVTLIAAAGYIILYFIWRVWTWSDTRVLLRRGDYDPERSYWTFVLSALALANCGIFISLGWGADDAPPEFRDLQWLQLPPLLGIVAWVPPFLFRFFKGRDKLLATLLEAAVATLLIAPLMGFVVALQLEGWVRTATSGISFALMCAIIVFGGALIRPENQGWSVPKPIARFVP